MLATLGGIGQLICDAVIMALCTLKVLTLSTLGRRPRVPISFSSSDSKGDGGPITAGETVEIGETAPGANAELMCVGGGVIMDRLKLLECEEDGGGGAERGAV